jgi:hypothetical protein
MRITIISARSYDWACGGVFCHLAELLALIFLAVLKKLAEFICQTENFSNFILGKHSGKGLFIILLATQINNFYRYFSNFQRVNFNKN